MAKKALTTARASAGRTNPGRTNAGRTASGRAAAGRTKTGGATRRAAGAPEKSRRFALSWLNRLLILVGSGVVVAAGLQAYATLQAIPVRQIIVTGKLENTQLKAVKELIHPALVGGFLSADLQRVQAKLEELAWIYQVSVRRRWPHTLEIHVVEQLPIARWGEAGFLNHEGQVFQPENSRAWQELPQLLGPPGTERGLMANYQRLQQLLAAADLPVTKLALDERGQLQAELRGGMTLVLGNVDLVERVQRFVQLYSTDLAAQGGEVLRVDMRYPSGVAVAFREPPQLAGLTNNQNMGE